MFTLQQIKNLILKFSSKGPDLVYPRIFPLLMLVSLFLSLAVLASNVSAQETGAYWFEVRSFEPRDLGVTRIGGLGYLPEAKALFVTDETSTESDSGLTVFTLNGGLFEKNRLAIPASSPLNLAFNDLTKGIYLLDESTAELVEVQAGPDAKRPPDGQGVTRQNVQAFGLVDPQGLSFDPATGQLYVLDANSQTLVRISPDASGGYDGDSAVNEGRVSLIRLKRLDGVQLRGIAFNPENGQLYVYSPAEKKMYQLDADGQLIATFDLAELRMDDLQGMVFAASGDMTDDPNQMSLYLADGGEKPRVVELSITDPVPTQRLVAPLAVNLPVTLVNVIDGSIWSPPNPDSSGVEFNMATGYLMVADSEVEEMTIYNGVNVYTSTKSGTLVSTCDTTHFSVEPTGMAVNPANGHVFFSDDNQRKIFEVHLGPDGVYCTADDFVTFISTLAFNDDDPEGLAFGNGKLFVTDGVGMEVNVISPGPNGVFDGQPPTGDDTYIHFDTSVMGMRDPEGLGYHWGRNTVFLVSRPDEKMVEFSLTGTVLNEYNIGPLNIYSPAGAAVGPNSVDASKWSVYISDRGVDNGQDPFENDGKVYEVYLNDAGGLTPVPSLTPTFGPSPTRTNTPVPVPIFDRRVNAGSDDAEQTIGTGAMNITSTDLDLGSTIVGMRFNNITVPPGAVITNAYIQFKTDAVAINATSLIIRGEAVDNAVTFTTATNNISSRPLTTASVAWSPPAWSTPDEVGVNQRTPNISSVVQEIVSRASWESGNSLVLVVSGSGDRSAWSYNGQIAGAPYLHIEFSLGGSTPTPSNTPTFTPTFTPTNTSSPTATFTSTNTPTPTATFTATFTPTATYTRTQTPTNTPSRTATFTSTTTPLPTATFTATFTPTATYTATLTPTITLSPTATFTPTVTNTPTPTNTPLPIQGFYISLEASGSTTLGSLTDVRDEDVVLFNGTNWTMVFDGSDVGVTGDVDAFHIVNSNTVLFSLLASANLPGVGAVQNYDIIQFNATSLGPNTDGTFSMYFDGEDVGLASGTSASAGNIDALTLLPDGRLLISTAGNISVSGINAADEDLLIFTPTTLGSVTSGTWALYFDGSDVGLGPTDIDAVDLDQNGDLYLSVLNNFSLAGISGANEDVFVCTPTSLGAKTTCTYQPTLFFDGSLHGLSSNDVDAFGLYYGSWSPPANPTSEPTATSTFEAMPTNTSVPPTATNTPIPPTTTPESTPTNTNTPLPATSTGTSLPPSATSTPTSPIATNTPEATPTLTNTPVPATPTFTPSPSATNQPSVPSGAIYISLQNSGPSTVGNLTGVNDEDIIYFDGSTWSIYFDGSDVGVTGDIDAFYRVDEDTFLFSIISPTTIGGMVVDDWDIIQFDATSLGPNTAGTFSMYFDGEDVGLNASSEGIDAIYLLPDGRLLISTIGTVSVPGVSGANEDLLAFTPTSLGLNTAGTWEMYFDGSDVGMGNFDVDGVVVAANGDIYLSTYETFSVPGLSADNEDVFICTPSSLGLNTACSFHPALYFDGSLWGLSGDNLNALFIP